MRPIAPPTESRVTATKARSSAATSAPPALSGPIAAIVPCPFPANHGTPGAIRELVETQARLGYDLHVFTYPFGDGDEIDPRVTVHRCAMLGGDRKIRVGPTLRKPLWNLMLIAQLCRMAREHHYSVIHAYNYEGALIGGHARLLLRRPLVFQHFNTMIDELPTYRFIRPQWLARLFARGLDYFVPRMASKIIAISHQIESFLHTQGIRAELIEQIPMGIDASIFQHRNGRAIRAEYGLGDRPIVMYTGLLNQFQRIDLLIEGMAEVVREHRDAVLMLVTNYVEPQDKTDLEQLIDRYGLHDRVIVTERQPFERVPDFLAAADVCVVSRPDCPGVAVKMLNYMAAGRAIVVPAGSAMNLTHGRDVFITADGDGVAIGQAVLEILENDALRKDLERNAPLELERQFGLAKICTDIGRVYAEVDRKRRPAARNTASERPTSRR